MPVEPVGDGTRGDRLRRLIEGGADIAGGAVGGAIGLIFGGPAGAVVGGAGGAAAAFSLKRIGQEIAGRLLGPREQIRVGAVLAMAASEIKDRITHGEGLRSDGFFGHDSSSRSDAEEVAESVLLRSQREAEERKLPYMAHILANIAFDSTINAPMAHQIVKAADALTYRQLCIMRLAVVKEPFNLRATDYRDHGSFDKELYQLLYECVDLYNRGFVNFGGEVAFGPTDVSPGRMNVQGLGVDLYNLMCLVGIPNNELIDIAIQLS